MTLEQNLLKLLNGKDKCAPLNALRVNEVRNKIKEGAFGVVYRAKLRDGRYVALKEITTKANTYGMAKFEYDIAKKLKGFGVPEHALYTKCPPNTKTKEGKEYIYMEYVNGEPLYEFLQSQPQRSTAEIHSIIVQVLYNMYRIRRKYGTEFRHHDLHGGNVLVRKVNRKILDIQIGDKKYKLRNAGVEAVIIDFGYATMRGSPNPMVVTGYSWVSEAGISQSSSIRYDLHYFLNEVYYMTTKLPEIRDRIKAIIPDPYLQRNKNGWLKKGRLIDGDRRLPANLRRNMRKRTDESLPSFGDAIKAFMAKDNFNKTSRVLVAQSGYMQGLRGLNSPPKPKSKLTPGYMQGLQNGLNNSPPKSKSKRTPTPKSKLTPGYMQRLQNGLNNSPPKSKSKHTPTPKSKSKRTPTPPLMLRNIHGKARQYKRKVWYDKAVARNKKEIERLKKTICGRAATTPGDPSKLQFTNVRGKVRKYKKKGWFNRAVVKNKDTIQRLKTTVC